MPAKSEKQRLAAGAALAPKRSQQSISGLKGDTKKMYESMSEEELAEMASSKDDNKHDKKNK